MPKILKQTKTNQNTPPILQNWMLDEKLEGDDGGGDGGGGGGDGGDGAIPSPSDVESPRSWS